MLKREGIPHQVLNAKFHELEAEIVAQAECCRHGDDRDEHGGPWYGYQADDVSREAGGLRGSSARSVTSPGVLTISCAAVPDARETLEESRFYISLEDDLMRLFGPERMMKGVYDTGRCGE